MRLNSKPKWNLWASIRSSFFFSFVDIAVVCAFFRFEIYLRILLLVTIQADITLFYFQFLFLFLKFDLSFYLLWIIIFDGNLHILFSKKQMKISPPHQFFRFVLALYVSSARPTDIYWNTMLSIFPQKTICVHKNKKT